LRELITLKEMRFYLNTSREIPSLVILAATEDITDKEKQLKLRHESPQELQNWNLVMLEAYNNSMQLDSEIIDKDKKTDNEHTLIQFHTKRKGVFDEYIQNEVQYVHHLQGLIPILSLELPELVEPETITETPKYKQVRKGNYFKWQNFTQNKSQNTHNHKFSFQ